MASLRLGRRPVDPAPPTAPPRRTGGQDRALLLSAATGSYEEFLALYRRSDAEHSVTGPDLLRRAVANRRDAASRTAIARRLLDDGVDPARAVGEDDATSTLHTFLARPSLEVTSDLPLLCRLLQAGADVALSLPGRGTPLEDLATQFAYTDVELHPLYDVLLARPELDPMQVSLNGRTVLDNIRAWTPHRDALVVQLERLLARRRAEVARAQ